METAGKEAEDAEVREAMKDAGIGTPATRAAIIERLVTVGYLEREGRSLVATEKAIQVVRLLGEHQLTSPELTGSWERRLRLIEQGEDTRPAFMKDIAAFTTETVQELDKLKGVKIERAKLGPCPICGREITENRKGYSCWSREDPGCGFVIWKKKAGKNLPVAVGKELIESLRASRERGEDPGVGRTEKPVTGFRSRAGRTFRAKLRLEQVEEGKWRVEFDEDWAKEPPKGEAEEERAEAEAAGKDNGATPPAEIAASGSATAAERRAGPRRERLIRPPAPAASFPPARSRSAAGPSSPSLIRSRASRAPDAPAAPRTPARGTSSRCSRAGCPWRWSTRSRRRRAAAPAGGCGRRSRGRRRAPAPRPRGAWRRARRGAGPRR